MLVAGALYVLGTVPRVLAFGTVPDGGTVPTSVPVPAPVGAAVAGAAAPATAAAIARQAPRPGALTGAVTDARTGRALAGALVDLPATGQSAVTDAGGQFRIDGIPPGRHEVVISRPGYASVQRALDVTPDAAPAALDVALEEGAGTFSESVTVGGGPFREAEAGVPGQVTLGTRDILGLRGVIADDPIRAMQVMPAVAGGDDFRAEFAVRGQGPRYIGLALDGVDSALLFHTVRGVRDTGSLALINSDVLESATLLTGAYPQRLGQRLGARLDVTTRDGSRDALTGRALVSLSATTTVVEGPLGRGGRGSWIAAARRSYVDWLLDRVGANIPGTFGFTDGQLKITLTPTPRQVLRASVVAGRAALRDYDETPSLNSLDDARNRTVVANVDWRYTPHPSVTLGQQVYAVQATYRNEVPDGRVRQQGSDRDVTWRTTIDWTRSPTQQLTAGVQGQALHATRLDQRFTSTSVISSLDARVSGVGGAAWLNLRWTPSTRVQVSSGVRAEQWATTGDLTLGPWLLAEWQAGASTRVLASAGRRQQAPSFDETLVLAASRPPPGALADPALRPERATTVDAGLEQRMGTTFRVRATVYRRMEDDALRYVDSEYRLRAGQLVRPGRARWANVLDGEARGMELTLERRVASGLSGWASYAWGRHRVTDRTSGETYWGNYDQRHGLNTFLGYRWSTGASIAARWRYGTNFPIQGYVARRAQDYVVSERRNETRLPAYSRLDLRADRSFAVGRRRLTLFAEVLNAEGRVNVGPGDGSLNTRTGVYSWLTEDLFPRLPSVGLLLSF